jgi:uncharacterized membrane protein
MHRFIVFIFSVSCAYICVNFSLFLSYVQSLDKGFSLTHIPSLMGGTDSKTITIFRARDAEVHARLFVDFQGVAHIADGWMNFVRQQGVLTLTECVLEFRKVNNCVNVCVHTVHSS